jgi:DNA-binding transcriptional MerR regulator/quercetin dioxygenase-like cupin family protein
MAFTVKQVAAMSGVSVRTLHFYDETDLLKPAYCGANGYRFYEEPQLLALQQILFYRELGFELKQIRSILGRADFEKVAALRSHRQVLQGNLSRMRRLTQTIDQTIQHLKGNQAMTGEEMFAGFRVAAGDDRFGEHVQLGGEPIDCKLSGQDTEGALSVFEFTGHGGGPRHRHHDQDEWIYVLDGEFQFEVGDKRCHAVSGECVFIPRKIAHVWGCTGDKPGKILNVYQPAGGMEEFIREVGNFKDKPPHEVLSLEELHRWFQAHGMDLLGPPLGWTEQET